VTLADEYYPKTLLEIPDPPPLLYAKGRLDLLNSPCIAIVGSRNASVQGEKNAEEFSNALSQQGYSIVSGMALGIDAAAHRGALKGNGSTIAVVGTGLDVVYPAKHRDLAHQIAERGLIISEFVLGTPSQPTNFPRRNRIISGLSLGCLVVEANIDSDSLITARLAIEQGREVFAIPGSIHSPVAKGCHLLIRQGAKLVEKTQDILEEINWSEVKNTHKSISPSGLMTHLGRAPSEANTILSSMGFDPIDFGTLQTLTALTTEAVSSMLIQLELDNKVTVLSGGKYQRHI
jgi:DNA processing protein